jgi:hypothetical protein
MRRALLVSLLVVIGGACGHSAGSGLKPMVDSPVIKFKAPDQDAIDDITGIDSSATPSAQGSNK